MFLHNSCRKSQQVIETCSCESRTPVFSLYNHIIFITHFFQANTYPLASYLYFLTMSNCQHLKERHINFHPYHPYTIHTIFTFRSIHVYLLLCHRKFLHADDGDNCVRARVCVCVCEGHGEIE